MGVFVVLIILGVIKMCFKNSTGTNSTLILKQIGTGVEVVKNEDCTDEVHGKGRYTEKRIHLSSRLPYWIQSICPQVFYVTEKAWNYYPFTITEYTCSFIPKLNISIHTKYEDNNGTTENVRLSLIDYF